MLDEADEMLSRGFKDQIYDIFQLLPPKIQVSGRLQCLSALLPWADAERCQLTVLSPAGGRVLGHAAPRGAGDHAQVHEQAGELSSTPTPPTHTTNTEQGAL